MTSSVKKIIKTEKISYTTSSEKKIINTEKIAFCYLESKLSHICKKNN